MFLVFIFSPSQSLAGVLLYLQGLSSTDEYIATQAPLPTTMADFWKMVFEQSSGVIVMLADPVENRRVII